MAGREEELQPIEPCGRCGRPPGGRVQVSAGLKLVWLECHTCGRRTSEGRAFPQAVWEWNQMQRRDPGGPGSS